MSLRRLSSLKPLFISSFQQNSVLQNQRICSYLAIHYQCEGRYFSCGRPNSHAILVPRQHTEFRLTPFNQNGERNLLLQETSAYLFQEKLLHRGRTRLNELSKDEKACSEKDDKPPQKLTLFQKFKAMYRDYWYVLVPVHLVTSAVWFGSFYYLSQTGVDIAALAEWAHFSDEMVEKIRKSGNTVVGHMTIAYLLYKVFTPLRYAVTVGGTTVSINYLKKWGMIKPMPKKDELKRMFDDKKVELRKNMKERHELLKKRVKLASKKRIKKTSDLVRRFMQMRKRNVKRG